MYPRLLPTPADSFFLFGPRGTGKTTWIQERFPEATVYDLLSTRESLRLSRDPSLFGEECAALPQGAWIVVDEVQKVPALLDEVQRLMTHRRQRFVLSGSSARKLRRGGANLLAGRASVRHLFPLLAPELGYGRKLDQILSSGMLPMAVESPQPPDFLRSYVETYLREEVQAEALVRQIGSFSRFLEVAARVNGQVVNVSGIARECGVARQTVQDYLQILIDTLIASWLPAWRAKAEVKQVMHSKFHLFDCGVARHLACLGHLPVHPEERGFLLETYVLGEIRAFLHYGGLDWPVFYWRTHDGAEVDFVVETPSGLLALKIKSSERWNRRYLSGITRLSTLEQNRNVKPLGVFCGPRPLQVEGVDILPWKEFLRRLWDGGILD